MKKENCLKRLKFVGNEKTLTPADHISTLLSYVPSAVITSGANKNEKLGNSFVPES